MTYCGHDKIAAIVVCFNFKYLIKQKKVIYLCSGTYFQQCLLHTNLIHSVCVFKFTFHYFTCILSAVSGLENLFVHEIIHLIAFVSYTLC